VGKKLTSAKSNGISIIANPVGQVWCAIADALRAAV
jgi:hypothetical protein